MPSDHYVVPDLHKIINFRALADQWCPARRPAVNSRIGADFHVVLNDDPADLRDFEVAGLAHGKAEPVLADGHAGVDRDAVADQGMGDGGIRPDIAVAADMDPIADRRSPRRWSCPARSGPLVRSPLPAPRSRRLRVWRSDESWLDGAVPLRRQRVLGLQRTGIKQGERLGEAPIRLWRHEAGGARRHLGRQTWERRGRRLRRSWRSSGTIFRIVDEGQIALQRRRRGDGRP